LKKLTKIGTHIFYTWKGRGGSPIAFTNFYSGKEAWPAKAAATAPELGVSEGEVLSAAAELEALSQKGSDTKEFGVNNASVLSDQIQDPNQSSSRAVPRPESQGAQSAFAANFDSVDTAAPYNLPEPGKDGLMPDPDISALIPKPKLSTNSSMPPPQGVQNYSAATVALPRREAPKSRALDGL
jgi:hypothetical protein